jgi:hypothetical protein
MTPASFLGTISAGLLAGALWSAAEGGPEPDAVQAPAPVWEAVEVSAGLNNWTATTATSGTMIYGSSSSASTTLCGVSPTGITYIIGTGGRSP